MYDDGPGMGDCFQFYLNGIEEITVFHEGNDAIRLENIEVTMLDQEVFKCSLEPGLVKEKRCLLQITVFQGTHRKTFYRMRN